MPRTFDLKALGAWCQAHDMTWSATRRDGADFTVILESPLRSGPAMRLVLDEPELRLENSVGEPLACASDLPSLLDAMDGGVAAPQWWC